MDDIDFCRFFADIEADPTAVVPQLTVIQYLLARQHILLCETCYDRCERVAEQNPKKNEFPDPGVN